MSCQTPILDHTPLGLTKREVENLARRKGHNLSNWTQDGLPAYAFCKDCGAVGKIRLATGQTVKTDLKKLTTTCPHA